MHLERSRVLSDKDTLEKVYQNLLEEHRTLQTNYVSNTSFNRRYFCIDGPWQEDVNAEKTELVAQLDQAKREIESMQTGGISSKVWFV